MKVLHAVNYHRFTWGTDRAWDKTIQLSRDDGIEAAVFARDSKALPPGLRGKVQAFAGGIYAREAVREFRGILETMRPDVVHTHELYPLISPWIIKTCASAGVPVVQICYDYRLTCPIATHFVHGQICRKCTGGREYQTVLNNCRDNLAESVGYGLRNAVARRFRLFTDYVSQFIVLTEFGRSWLMREVGIEPERITIQPCVIPMPPANPEPARADYIAYAGRFAFEKGVHVLIEAARRTGLPVRLAGNAESHPDIGPGDNIICVPTRSPAELADFYRHARFLVVPSLWEETFSVVSAESMSHGVPVLAARIGAIPDTVLDGVTGQFFTPGDVDDLAGAMRRLWADPALCRRLGEAGRNRVAMEFDEASHLRQLRLAYGRAISSPAFASGALSGRSNSKQHV
jgi:glycosyltransferase involved in cell wall biosynthesis